MMFQIEEGPNILIKMIIEKIMKTKVSTLKIKKCKSDTFVCMNGRLTEGRKVGTYPNRDFASHPGSKQTFLLP